MNLPPWLGVNFANEVERGKPRLTKESEDLVFMLSKLQLEQAEMPFEDYMIMEGEDISEIEFCISELVGMTLGQE